MNLSVIAPVQWLVDLFIPIIEFLHSILGSWGWSIIALTVLIRLVLLPLAIKSFRSLQGMATIAPQMKVVQEKYKDDKPRQQQEVMKLYKEAGANPVGGCLPIIAQFPVFIALFYMLRTDLRDEICNQSARSCGSIPGGPFGEEFLFIPDITAKATGAVLVVLLVLYVGSQLLSFVVNQNPTMDKTQKRIFMALPFVFVPFILNFPAGLLVYWITTNLFTGVQQFALRRIYGVTPPTAADAVAATATAPAAGATPATMPSVSTKAPPRPPRQKKKQRSGRRK